MKKLTKIKLINWMYFVDSTIEISGNTLITGVNASGKSTIIDALQFLFMGGIRGVKFNSAANEQGKRTLDGYLRGKISTEGQEYLRNSNCIGHIAVEITDEKDESSIIGVVLDTQSNNPQVKTVFYKIDNTKLVDDYFINKEIYPNSFRELEKFAKIHSKQLIRFGTTEQYRMMLKTYLGIDSQKYAKLLPSAIGVGSVTKMDDFINQFLLEEDLVEVNDLQDNIQNMNRLIEKINLDEKKLKELEVILEKGNFIAGRKEKLSIIDIARLIAIYKDYDNSIKRFESEIEDARKNRKIKKELLSQKQTEEQNQNTIVMELQKALDQNDENKALMALDKRLKEIEIDLERENERFADAKDGLRKIKSCIDRLVVDGYQELAVHSPELDTSKGSTILIKLIKDLHIRLAEIKFTLTNMEHALREKLKDNIAKTKENNDKLENLRKNIKAYPGYVVTLISNINRRLSERYGKEIEVKPLCEYVDAVDETWRNALEGYLNTQRFDIICEPKLFDECLEIYEEIKFKHGIYGIGIVNTNKYYSDIEPKAGTLADKITFYNKFARNYAFNLLNRVVCVDKLHDLKQHENAITATCMRYANHVARQIQPQIYSTPFLGLEANKIFIKNLENDNIELGEQHSKLTDELYTTTRCVKSVDEAGIEWLSNNDHCLMSIDNRQALLKDKAKEEKAKSELEKNPTYFFLNEKLEKEKKKYGIIRDEVTGIKSNIETIAKAIEKTNLDIDKRMDGRAYSEEQLKDAARKHRELMPEAEKRYKESSSGKSDLQSIFTSLDNAKNNFLTNKLENELTGIMTQYCMTFNFSAGKNYDALDFYQQERNIIADSNLIKYKGDLEDIATNINKIFQEHFIVEIRKRIKNCFEQIAVLNKQLKEKHFGDDQYKMECKPTQDAELRRYYLLIMDENYENIGTLFSDTATEKYSQDFSRMIEEITAAAAKGEQNRLLDYRKYLNFDIIITGKNGTRRFSDLKHIQSGGEGQVPFYIIAAVSFQNLLTKSRTRSNLCVVLFDEAFNNMDPQRIKTMMEFYSSLNLQIFLSLTGEKIGNIMKYMDTTVMVIREGKDVQVKELWGRYDDN